MKLPLFPLDAVLFPGAPLPLHIFEMRYREMIAECLAAPSRFGVVRGQPRGLARVGSSARILRVVERYPDGRMDILTEGVERFEITALDDSRACLQAEVELLPDDGPAASREQREQCAAMHFEVMELAGLGAARLPLDLDGPVSFDLAWRVPADLDFKQQLLMCRSDRERTERLSKFYAIVLPKLRSGLTASRRAAANGHVH
jgi:Lon protease-like protein